MIKDIKYGSLEWKIFQYKQQLKAKRGHNYSYLTDELYQDLIKKGYNLHVFNDGNSTTMLECEAKDVVDDYRKKGFYARIICETSMIRCKFFGVWHKKRKNK